MTKDFLISEFPFWFQKMYIYIYNNFAQVYFKYLGFLIHKVASNKIILMC